MNDPEAEASKRDKIHSEAAAQAGEGRGDKGGRSGKLRAGALQNWGLSVLAQDRGTPAF